MSKAGQSFAIQVKDLRKTYRSGIFRRRRVQALRGVSLEVDRGEIFGLLGPNGAGKTTLIKVLLGIVRRTGGSASLLGRPPGDRQGRRQVGYLPENHRIPRHHTGNTALEYYGSLSGVALSEIKRRRPELLDLVGLAQWGKTSVRDYSKGMQQRLGLAQALLHNPEILILDEPTDGVDPVGRSEIRDLLKRLKDEGKTVFINSHLLQEIELVCDRVAILDKGQVLRVDSVAEMTASPISEVKFRLQASLADGANRIRVALSKHEVLNFDDSQPDLVEVVVRVNDQPQVDDGVDQLRGQGISILGITRQRQTLEEAFLDIVNRTTDVPS